MKKKLIFVLVALTGMSMLLGPILLGLVAVIFSASASASQNPCITSVVNPVGGPVRLPVTGAFTITSEYGMRYNPGPYGNGVYRLHGGIDLVMTGTSKTVVASSAGVVSSLPTDPTGGGNMVVVDHGGGVNTVYMHLASRSVTPGEKVWPGKPLGMEGSTGNSTGPHLHFTVKVNGQPVDPRQWLTTQGLTLPPTRGTATAPPAVTTATPGSTPTGNTDPILATPGTGTITAKPVISNLPAQVGPYKGEQVVNAGYVIKAGQAMGLDAKTITIGVMTAMGESSLVNIGYGDAAGPDSRGLFQQRANGAWGTLADRMNPTIASTNFFKALIAVPGYLQMEPTLAAHKAQRNADPYHYQPYWADAVLMVSTLTADPSLLESLPAGGFLEGCEGGGPGEPLNPGDGSGAAIVSAAKHYQGTPYSWGGGNYQGPSLGIYSSPSLDGTKTVGFDCSGLVMFAVYNSTGIQLPHSAEDQGMDARGTTVPRDWTKMQPGDVIAFSGNGSGSPGSFGHVGIYIGNGQMIHAPRPGKTVEIVQLKGSSYYEPMAWSIKRYAKTGATA